jgi:hypothetical protein
MRKKTKQSVDVASVANAWQALFDSKKNTTREQLFKDGWIDANFAAEKMGVSAQTAADRLKKSNTVQKKFSIIWLDGKTRSVNFYKMK